MDWYQAASLVVAVLFGGQGIRSWIQTKRSKKKGLPADEYVATAAASSPAVQWLTDYYKNELESLRGDLKSQLAGLAAEVDELRRQKQDDDDYIDDLEAHIWQQKPPPPPKRRRRHERNSDDRNS